MSLLERFMRTLFRTGGPDAGGLAPDEHDAKLVLPQADAAFRGGRLNDALRIYHGCIARDPRLLDAHLGAAAVLVDLWDLDGAVDAYACAHEIAPASAAVLSAWLFHRHYAAPLDAQALAAAHRRYGQLFSRSGETTNTSARDPQRRLRIGYVSPNLSRHSVGYFAEPVIRCHDRGQFDVFCYYNHELADDATERMRKLADGWREIAGKDDATVARMIVDDRIDILVDLAGHSKGNRLAVFARKPAPVQMTWLGYPDTTGLAAIDWRLTDAMTDPAPAAELRHSEKLARIDGCFLCYEPPADAPAVRLRESGAPIVFGSFNHLAKVNRTTLALWARVLDAVPGSQLVLKSAPLKFPDTVDRVIEAFEQCGIDPARVELRGWAGAREQHLEAYGDIDIALDTFPYNGTTTTCEALWMGVPVVTLAGDVHMSRVGASLLAAAGLNDLIAHDADGFVKIVVEIARDYARRRELRSGLRQQLARSRLLDHQGFTRGLEAQYRHAWRCCCAQA